MACVIGIDFGTDSARAVVVDAASGDVLSSGASAYSRWSKRLYCGAPVFRQHPLDHLQSMEEAVRIAVDALGSGQRDAITAIAADATGSTVCPVDINGTPLALKPGFEDDPDAMFHLWKDHSAVAEAAELNALFDSPEYDYTRYQGKYSSEWYWAKALHSCRKNARVREESASWIELADYIPAVLTGNTNPKAMYRCSCAAGHKALWHADFNGLPSGECLEKADPYLARIAQNYAQTPLPSTAKTGMLTYDWAKRFHLNKSIVVGGSSLDAHAGAVGAGIRPGVLVKVIGTSTVDMAVCPEQAVKGKRLKTVCGMAQSSIIPGLCGIEAGQSAFGDIFAWFCSLLLWGANNSGFSPVCGRAEASGELLRALERTAAENDEINDIYALDWFNGRRYPDNDDSLKSVITGLCTDSGAPDIYRALARAAVFGSKRIFDSLKSGGIAINRVVAVGGIAQKSPYIMQLMSDALDMPIAVPASEQTCALGAAMYAAVAAGLYPDIQSASLNMSAKPGIVYLPCAARVRRLAREYAKYLLLSEDAERLDAVLK